MTLDVIDLARRLVRCDTVAGGERQALGLLESLLARAGFSCAYDLYDPARPDRANLIARLRPGAPASPGDKALLFGGHIDTVPFGDAAWAIPPLEGIVKDGRLHGRGAADMKGGLAAMVCAALDMAPRLKRRDLILHIYGSEETGCTGSFHASLTPEHFGSPGAAVIAEPTNNIPLAGHKGALWLAVTATGRTAHASMPEKGDNALLKMLPAALRLRDAPPKASHELLGECTMVLSTLHAGLNSNSVPDKAVLTVDMRTVPGQDHAALHASLAAAAGPDVDTRITLDLPPVWTDPDTPWCGRVRRLAAPFLGYEPGVAAVQFFTDAGAVRRAHPGLPLMILGPGDPGEAHRTDESCPVDQIRAAREMYKAIIADWYEGC